MKRLKEFRIEAADLLRKSPATSTRRAVGMDQPSGHSPGVVTVVIPLVLPLLVVYQLGIRANAFFALPWLIAESLGFLMWNISSSYLVEASHDRAQNAALMRRTIRLSLLVGGIGVPFILVTGRSEVEHGTVTPNERGNDEKRPAMAVDAFIAELRERVARKV